MNIKLIDREWNACLNKYQNMWLANDSSELTPNFDPDGAEGSAVIVISEGATYMKNCNCKWQKCGTTEVIA